MQIHLKFILKINFNNNTGYLFFERKTKIMLLTSKKGINVERFEEDILNPNTLKNLIINKEKIIKQNIYVTPSFIINNKLINDEFSLYTLENLINEELENEK